MEQLPTPIKSGILNNVDGTIYYRSNQLTIDIVYEMVSALAKQPFKARPKRAYINKKTKLWDKN